MSLLQRTASALAGDRTGKTDLNLDQIRTDGGTQPRAEINMTVVRDYAEAITGGVELPAVTVFYDGTAYWLADGFHRLAAHRLADKRSIFADVRQGTQRDAVLWSVGANADHGLRRTDEDKRRAVLRLLEDKEWNGWSDREIARQCKVSPTFVGKLRSGLTVHVDSDQPQERTYTTKHGTQATMRTERIGTKVSEDRIRQWLLDYTDRQGRTWRELSDNQIYHANSPCYQSFTAAFPTLSNPKQLLVNALVWIRSDAETTQRIKDAERLYVRDGQPTPTSNIGGQAKADQQRCLETTAAGLPSMGMVDRATRPANIVPDRRLGQLAATLAAALTSLDDDDLRNAAAKINIGMAYGDTINKLRRLHQLTKLALRQ